MPLRGASLPEEKIQALKHAHAADFKTSESVEPMIDTVEGTIALYRTVEPYVTKDIWFGKMNNIKYRVETRDLQTRNAVSAIYKNQSDKNIQHLYRKLKDMPEVMWKDSIRQVVSLTLSDHLE